MLALNLGADGVNAAGAAGSQLVIADVNAEYSTIHLTLGAQNSFVNIIDNGLTTLDTSMPEQERSSVRPETRQLSILK